MAQIECWIYFKILLTWRNKFCYIALEAWRDLKKASDHYWHCTACNVALNCVETFIEVHIAQKNCSTCELHSCYQSCFKHMSMLQWVQINKFKFVGPSESVLMKKSLDFYGQFLQ